MMDDFIYGEPQSSSDEMASSAAASDESATAASDESTTAATDESTTTAASESPALTVNNGSVSGDSAPGTVVTVTANDPPPGQQFAGWTDDIQILANPTLPTATATIPSTAVTITANYVDASATEP